MPRRVRAAGAASRITRASFMSLIRTRVRALLSRENSTDPDDRTDAGFIEQLGVLGLTGNSRVRIGVRVRWAFRERCYAGDDFDYLAVCKTMLSYGTAYYQRIDLEK